jgi:Skp family chaperone for outer membrane proteins
MNRPRICFTAVAFFTAVCLLAHGENPTHNDEYQAPDRLRVAVVDIAQVWKQSTELKAQLAEVKKKVEAAEGQVKEQQKRISELQTPRQTDGAIVPPSEKSVEQLNSLLNQAIGAQREQLMQEEGTIYYELLQKIDKAIEHCVNRHGIQMVFKVNTDPVDPKDRNDVLRGINKSICYFDPRLDITEEVLADLNKSNP